MKCNICNKKTEETFLKKPIGTYVRDSKGKRKIICSECQSKLSIEEIKAKL